VLVAGVDVGNSTTEIAFARVEPGRAPSFQLVLRGPTSGPKGSLACVDGVRELLERGARRLGEPPRRLLLAELHPVETALLELGREEEHGLGRAAIARPASDTPSGLGVGAGTLRRLAELDADPPGTPVIAVVVDEDFDEAAALLRAAREAGVRLAGAIVRGDDAVLIGNRVDRTLPIVDEVRDAAELPAGAHAVVEVAAAGESVVELADPLRLAVLLGLEREETGDARRAARALAGRRAAIAVRAPGRPAVARDTAADPFAGLDGPPPAVGALRELRLDGVSHGDLLDAFWTPLPAPPEDARLRRSLVRRHAVGLALLARGEAADLVAALDGLAAGGATVVAPEPAAAVRGAATTPGADADPLVIDLGGGTVDVHGAGGTAVAAGAGELVTRLCGGLLQCDRWLAERAKRGRGARVETPFVLHHEDGSRSFLHEPAPPRSVGRLCVVEPRGLEPLDVPLAPETWRGLRRAAKRSVLAVNAGRALHAAGGAGAGRVVLLVGGCASDPEVVDEVAATLEEGGAVVARGDVLGRHGPRAAVACGLVLLHAERR
jgi:Diol dehydratase reactivase ATPase-like domain/DD-reactivating factor swiveling domain